MWITNATCTNEQRRLRKQSEAVSFFVGYCTFEYACLEEWRADKRQDELLVEVLQRVADMLGSHAVYEEGDDCQLRSAHCSRNTWPMQTGDVDARADMAVRAQE